MTTFDQKAWRQDKRVKRVRRYRERLEQQRPDLEPIGAWLLAIDRDDAGDDRAIGSTESPLEAR